jgi:hypothetical protein
MDPWNVIKMYDVQNFCRKTSKKEVTWEMQAYIGLIISKLIKKQDVVAWSGSGHGCTAT